jgi:hypothetical protein
MEAIIGHPMDGIINRFGDLTADLAAGAIRVVRHSSLASRDIEAGAPVNLARRGYDWSGTLGSRRRAPRMAMRRGIPSIGLPAS